MPRKTHIPIKLPPQQPDRCIDCPLLGLAPKYDPQRPKHSKETMVCLGTMEALTVMGSRSKASERTPKHPLHRPCDKYWDAWLSLPRRELGIAVRYYNELRIPYLQTQMLPIKYHNKK